MIKKAMKELSFLGKIKKESSFYESKAWGFSSTSKFLNKSTLVLSNIEPFEMLDLILKIEKSLGRKRIGKQYVSRKIDIDILFVNDMIIKDKRLIVPHPKLHLRRFALLPLFEIEKEKKHPKINISVREMLNICRDKIKVEKICNV